MTVQHPITVRASKRKAPRPWLAGALTFMAPGAGYAYAGHQRRGLVVVTALAAAAVVDGALVMTPWRSRAAWLAALGIALVLAVASQVAAVWGAVRTARQRDRTGMGRWLRWLAALGLAIGGLFIFEGVRRLCEHWIGRSYFVPSEAMLPTLPVGDHLFTQPGLYRSRDPARGDIVIVHLARDGRTIYPPDRRPELPVEAFIERIVGLPGDVIELDGAALIVNGARVTEATAAGGFTDGSGRDLVAHAEALDGRRYRVLDDPAVGAPRFGPREVEQGRYFLLGDNRDNSYDSRMFGTLARSDVEAPTGRIYWSWPFAGSISKVLVNGTLPEEAWSGVRWERIWTETNPADRGGS